MIEVENFSKIHVCRKRIRRLTEAFLLEYKKVGYDVSISLLEPQAMAKLNKSLRGKTGSTDVLSLPALKVKGSKFYGEILLEPEFIKKQAKELKVAFLKEFDFILIHGLLHLSGLDDDTEKKRLKMIKIGEDFLAKL